MSKNNKNYEENRKLKIERHRKRRENKERTDFPTKKEVFLTNTLKLLNHDQFKVSVNHDTSICIKIPSKFSLISNHDQTTETLWKLNYVLSICEIEEVFLDYSECDELGIETQTMVDLMLKNWKAFKNRSRVQFRLKGNYPKGSAKAVFINEGTVKHFNIDNEKYDNFAGINPFNKKSDINDVLNEVVVYYQQCLKLHGFDLTATGIDNLNHLVSEILINADEHSGVNGEWYVSGHFHKENKDSSISECLISFISLGNTIYDNMTNSISSSELENTLKKHSKTRGWLADLTRAKKENLYNLYSLQYKVSSKRNESSGDVDRGVGTVKFIEHFQQFGNTTDDKNPEMAIYSGYTHITFDGKYKLTDKISEDGNKIKVIAFNKNNDLSENYDSNYIKSTKHKFPGTVISLKFYIDENYIKRFCETTKGENNDE